MASLTCYGVTFTFTPLKSSIIQHVGGEIYIYSYVRPYSDDIPARTEPSRLRKEMALPALRTALESSVYIPVTITHNATHC